VDRRVIVEVVAKSEVISSPPVGNRCPHTARSEILTAVKIQIEVFWVVTPCGVVVGCQCFGGPCCLCLHAKGQIRVKVFWVVTPCIDVVGFHRFGGFAASVFMA
jgi:hypothetical protein